MNLSALQKRIFVTLLFIGTFANMDKGMIGLTIAALKRPIEQGGEGWTASQAGWIASIFYISFILVTLPGGWIVDRFGYRKFVMVSLTILIVGSSLFGVAGFSGKPAVFLLLPLARLLTGFGHAGYTNGTPPIIARNFSDAQRGSVQGKVVATAGIGPILAYTLGAWVIGIDWRYAYFMIAAFFAVALILFTLLVPEAPFEQAKGAPKVKFADAWKNRNTLVLAGALLFNNLVGVGVLTWLPDMWNVTFQPDQFTLTIVLIVYALTVMIATAVAPDLVRKHFKGKEKPFMLACTVVSAVFLYLAVVAPNLWLSAAGLYAANLAMMTSFATLLLLPYQLIPMRIIGSAFAVINIGAFVGGIMQGFTIGYLVQMSGYSLAFLVLSGCIIVSGLIPYLYQEQDPEKLNAPPADHKAPAGK